MPAAGIESVEEKDFHEPWLPPPLEGVTICSLPLRCVRAFGSELMSRGSLLESQWGQPAQIAAVEAKVGTRPASPGWLVLLRTCNREEGRALDRAKWSLPGECAQGLPLGLQAPRPASTPPSWHSLPDGLSIPPSLNATSTLTETVYFLIGG